MTTEAPARVTAATVLKLLTDPNAHPLERVQTAVTAGDPLVGERLHAGHELRPFAMARLSDGWELIAFDDDIVRAVLTGAHAWARLGRRLRDRDLLGDGGTMLRMDITTPAHWRHGRGRYTTMPDPRLVFGADDALQADLSSPHRNPRHTLWLHWLAWGGCPLQPLATDELSRVPLVIEQSRVLRWDSGHAGIVGTVRYDLSALGSDARETVWALARFAELRGIGKHTTYGMGRVRLRA